MKKNIVYTGTPGNMDCLARTFAEVMQRYFEDPENMRRFEAWKAEQAAKQAAEECSC